VDTPFDWRVYSAVTGKYLMKYQLFSMIIGHNSIVIDELLININKF